MRLLVTALVALLGMTQYRLWVGDESIATVWRLEHAVEAQTIENERLEARNRRLEAEVHDLKEGLDAVEQLARRDLGMVREGETFYHFVEPR